MVSEELDAYFSNNTEDKDDYDDDDDDDDHDHDDDFSRCTLSIFTTFLCVAFITKTARLVNTFILFIFYISYSYSTKNMRYYNDMISITIQTLKSSCIAKHVYIRLVSR